MTPDVIHTGLSFVAICIGIAVCLLVFMGLAAWGHSMSARTPEDQEPRPWLHREVGE